MSAGYTRRALLGALALAPVLASATGRRALSAPSPAPPAELLRLAGTCVMTGWHGQVIPFEVRRLLRRGALGGVLLTNHNFVTRQGLAALTAAIAAIAPEGAKPLVSADQEGGPVAHLSPPLSVFPSMTALGQLDDEDLTHRVGAALGSELRSVGVTFDLAPVLDVRTSSSNTVVLNRVFGREPQRVARHGRALIDGLLSAGVLACAKHFPGHGDTVMDSHVGLPRVAHDLARLDAVELVPFRACAPIVPAVMVAHILYTAIDTAAPSSLSRAVVEGLLRQRVGFDGVAITDDLQMAAIRAMHPIERAAELAMRAGNDMLLIAHTPTLALSAVEHLARTAEHDATLRARLEEAAARVVRLRARLDSPIPPNPFPVDPASVVREVARRMVALGAASRRGGWWSSTRGASRRWTAPDRGSRT
ncbi:MAG: glycoside hydrolase family 3 N-terminal domain-containing protein [Deltaproteobacteria bacterium]